MSARIVLFQIDIFFLLSSKFTLYRPTNIKTAFVPLFVFWYAINYRKHFE